MMISSFPTSTSTYTRVDHRTVLKKLHIERNRKEYTNFNCKCNTTNNILTPINNLRENNETKLGRNNTLVSLSANTGTYSLHGSKPAPTLPSKTKIPTPLAILWKNSKKVHNYRRFSSLRTCGEKMSEKTVSDTNEQNTHETTTIASATGRQQFSTRKKLALTDVNLADSAISLTRSLSCKALDNSHKKSCSNFCDNKTDSPKEKICAAMAIKSLSLHDVAKTEYQNDGRDKTTTTASITTETDKPTTTPTFVDKAKDLNKMSLNQDGVKTTQINTTAETTATEKVALQARPLTLTNSSTKTVIVSAKGLKSPKSPKTGGNYITATSTPNAHHQHLTNLHNPTSQSQSKTSPGSKQSPKTPPVTPDSPTTYLKDDLDSLFSYDTSTSGRSTMSCEHPYVARNGTTFSGRKMKYVVHCSNYAGQVGSDYLTPTQRAQRQLRRLKELLSAAREDLEQKDSEIIRLTREVVELRLFKASLSSPDERSASSDAVTVREAELKTSQDVSPIVDMVDDAQKTPSPRHHVHSPSAILHHQQHLPQSSLHQQQHNMMHVSSDMQSSFADSGHFEDMTSSSVHSKDSSSYAPSLHINAHDQACDSDMASCSPSALATPAVTVEQYELQRQELIRMYEQRIEDLIRNQDATSSEMKRTNCDRIEALLQKLAECNTRYADIVPDYEHAKERIRELEKQLEELQRRLAEHEDKQKQMYLHMYQKGQEAERIARADHALELAHRAPQNKVSINELLLQLQSTQDELENIRAAECRNECGNNHALLTAKEAISLWVLGARKTIYRRLLEAQKSRTHVDPEVTLQFLKSAVYYFLTDKENSQGHLQAIESILEFSEAEKQTITRARSAK